jgi:tetrathionate reductase subunit B
MGKVFVIDVGICNGCYSCQISCKDEHVGNDWSPIAKPQPDAGQFWMKLEEHICGTVPKVKMHYIPLLCQHCDNAPCIPACPIKAIYKREDSLVIIDANKCNGCKACVDACPYHAIYWPRNAPAVLTCWTAANGRFRAAPIPARPKLSSSARNPSLKRSSQKPRCLSRKPRQNLEYII